MHFDLGTYTSCSDANINLVNAAHFGIKALVQFLLKCDDIDVNTGVDWKGRTPLFMASEEGHASVVHLLLNIPNIDVNKGKHSGQNKESPHSGLTPLMQAIFKNNSEIVYMLLGHPKIDINKEEKSGSTALTVAIEKGNLEITNVLLNNSQTDVNRGKITPLGTACMRGWNLQMNLAAVKVLLKHPQIDVNKGLTGAPLYLASNNHPETPQIVNLLLQHSAVDVNKKNGNDGETALYQASQNGRTKSLQQLLKHPDIDMNEERTIDGATPLYSATDNNRVEVVNILVECSMRVNEKVSEMCPAPEGSGKIDINMARKKDGRTPLYNAADRGYEEIIKLLLRNPNTDVNKAEINLGTTPLHISVVKARAASRNDVKWEKTVKLLLNHSFINVNKGDRLGRTPLYLMAAKFDSFKDIFSIHKNNDVSIKHQNNMVDLLLKHTKIDVNKGKFDRKNPLFAASEDCNLDVVKMLLAHAKIDVNYSDFHGKTALFHSCPDAQSNKEKMIEVFLRCPSTNLNQKDEHDKRIIDYVSLQTSIINMIENRTYLRLKGHTCCSDDINEGLHIAAEAGNLGWVEIFLKCPQIDINKGNKYGLTPLYILAKESNRSVECSSPPTSYILATYTRMHDPCHSKVMEIVLKDPFIDINHEVNFKTALMIVAELGFENALSQLLNHSEVVVNLQNAGDGKTALILAAEHGHPVAVMLLLHNHQIDPNVLDFYGETALRKASQKGFLRVVKLLLQCPKTKASIDDATHWMDDDDEDGKFVQHKEVIKAIKSRLILLKMKTTCCHNVSANFLHTAKHGNYREVQGLLKCPDLDVNVRNLKGHTALYVASARNHKEVIKVLLKNQYVDRNQVANLDGGTAFSVASEKSHFQVMELLVSWDFVKHMETQVSLGWCRDSWTYHLTNCKESEQMTIPLIPSTVPLTGENRNG